VQVGSAAFHRNAEKIINIHVLGENPAASSMMTDAEDADEMTEVTGLSRAPA